MTENTDARHSPTRIVAVLGDITEQHVDAIVNAANSQMRGGGGVDGAIHRVGGPAILQDSIVRFPNGFDVGDAGWTTAGELPARWVIHTVGPNYAAGQQDPDLLESCYARSLQVADELGARTVAFPLVGTGVYCWPEKEAIQLAVRGIAAAKTSVEEVRIVAFSQHLLERVEYALAQENPMKILLAVRLLHDRGYHNLRILPGLNASGTAWRVQVSVAKRSNCEHDAHLREVPDQGFWYTTAAGVNVGDEIVTISTSIDDVANLILREFPGLTPTASDPEYVHWYAGLLELCELHQTWPVAYSDYYPSTSDWQIGWSNGIRYRKPPAPVS